MIRKRRRQLMGWYLLGDVVAIFLAFHATYLLRFYSGLLDTPKGIPAYRSYVLWVLPALFLIHLMDFARQGYYRLKLRRNRLDDLLLVLINAVVTSVGILLFFSYFKSYRVIDFEVSHLFLAVYVPVATVFLVTARIGTFRAYTRWSGGRNGVSRVLIAGSGELARMVAEKLAKYRHFGIEIVGSLTDQPQLDRLGGLRDLPRVAREHQITDLFIALPIREYLSIRRLIDQANRLYLDVKLVPDFLHLVSLRAGMEHLEGIPTISMDDIPLRGSGLIVKRLMDLLLSFLGLLLLSPVLLFLALAVRWGSRGPIFYRQVRVGLDGKHFSMFKFRSMVVDAEEKTGPVWSRPGDARVTRVGRWMRKYSLDELLQLWNVLRGDMSLVGPRPERPELVHQFQDHVPRYMLRHRVKTGMTGWAQVHGLRGDTSLSQRIEFDIFYIQNWSLRLDVEILWRTILKCQFVDRNL